ncbi:NACHT domain-containing protein [Holosporaceae bacterium 'Namur']|nr:NACHT domain-containing protein [Holosporaceae bacterium 'Namur']
MRVERVDIIENEQQEITSLLTGYHLNYKNLNNLIIKDQPISASYINLAILKKRLIEEKEKELREKQGTESEGNDKVGKLRDERLETYESMYEEKEAIEVEQLFEKRKSKEIKKLAIYGRAGIGKSTLCQYIAVRWSEGDLWNDKYKGVIWLPLRKIASELNKQQGEVSLAEVVRNYCIGGRERYKPSVEGIDDLAQYIMRVIQAMFISPEEGLKNIYGVNLSANIRNITREIGSYIESWPYHQIQSEDNGNCILSSYNLGISVRHGEGIFQWLTTYETREIAAANQRHMGSSPNVNNSRRNQGFGQFIEYYNQ